MIRILPLIVFFIFMLLLIRHDFYSNGFTWNIKDWCLGIFCSALLTIAVGRLMIIIIDFLGVI